MGGVPVVGVASVLAGVLLAGAVLGGCGGDSADRSAVPAELSGSWVLDPTASGSPDFGTTVNVDATFAERAVSGTGGCNRYSAATDAGADGSLTVGAIRSTKMMCTPEAAAVEDDYLTRLAAAESFASAGGRLRITNSAGADLVFAR